MKPHRFLIAITAFFFLFTGCSSKNDYHEGGDLCWIQQEVEKGRLTPEEAQILIEEELMKEPDKTLEK